MAATRLSNTLDENLPQTQISTDNQLRGSVTNTLRLDLLCWPIHLKSTRSHRTSLRPTGLVPVVVWFGNYVDLFRFVRSGFGGFFVERQQAVVDFQGE